MSRCGYSDDLDNLALGRWRAQVASAIRGKRGQTFLKELLAALDALPQKELIYHEFVTAQGEVCALGSVARMRQIPEAEKIDSEDHEDIAERFNIARQLVQEIEFINDEWLSPNANPKHRFEIVRRWVVSQIVEVPAA